jgi:replication-associated recombination protein RarA
MRQNVFEFPQPLTEKYRPQRIEDFLGLVNVKPAMLNLARAPRPSAWLFLGPSGTGKTCMAFALAKALPAEVIHIPSRTCGLDAVTKMVDRCHYVPGGFASDAAGARWWMPIIEEADQMSYAAQLAFLSLTDHTARPPASILIFTANATEHLEERFLSRLNVVEFSNGGTAAALPGFLREVWKRETTKAQRARREPEFDKMAVESHGNVREAMNRLEVALLSGGVMDLPNLPKRGAVPLTVFQERARKAVVTVGLLRARR